MAKKITIQPNNPHFFKFIKCDSLQGISIPRAFVKDYLVGEKCEGKKARLRTKKSKKSWIVSTKGCCFTDGWENFHNENDLHAGDFLLFEHKGGFTFDVLVFDDSMCEKAYPPLDGDAKDDEIVMEIDKPTKKRKYQNKKLAQIFSSSNLKNTAKVKNPLQLIVEMKPSHFKWRTFHVSAPFGRESGLVRIAKLAKDTNKSYMITIKDPNGKSWKLRLNYKPSANVACFGSGWPEFRKANKLKVGDVCTFMVVSMTSQKILLEMSVCKCKASF
ncbi:hypothetical protein AQUCO_01400275v1 [Aquilegia coerulea]|uniref:TF-B3 domain-containing protein n=1 Tax=Aquilegia coerulea TaxID=218851 RepID=A0A2G5DVI8_AQUCA|nr:hypothetical protein AQUCO_01400275v1 [Aquilegia coerulea]